MDKDKEIERQNHEYNQMIRENEQRMEAEEIKRQKHGYLSEPNAFIRYSDRPINGEAVLLKYIAKLGEKDKAIKFRFDQVVTKWLPKSMIQVNGYKRLIRTAKNLAENWKILDFQEFDEDYKQLRQKSKKFAEFRQRNRKK